MDFFSCSDKSSVPGVNRNDLHRISVLRPPLSEQLAICSILGSLDDKIEHNRQTSQTLEKLARAIFKAWFIDFEPVRAKAAGAKSFPGMPQEAFDALPKRLVETELGEAPEGWEVGTMGDIGLQRREQVSPSETETGTPYIGLEHMPRRCVSLGEWGMSDVVSSAKSRFRRGDILFGKLRPYFHKVGLAPVDGVCSTDIVVLHASETVWTEWLLLLVSSDEFVSHTDQTSAGTKMPRTNWKDMAAYKVLLAPTKLVSAFHQIMRPMFELITHSVHESRKLAELRDYLLPKLLSGKVRVREAEKLVQRKS